MIGCEKPILFKIFSCSVINLAPQPNKNCIAVKKTKKKSSAVGQPEPAEAVSAQVVEQVLPHDDFAAEEAELAAPPARV